MARDKMPSLLDRAVRSHDDDAFGHEHFADGLRSLIEDSAHEPPYTIGLLGTWGTGKSTIKEIYSEELKKDISKENQVERRRRVHTVEFNAWRHGNEDIKRALLRQVFISLGGKDEDLHREFFCQVQRVTPERKPFWDFAIEVVEGRLIPILLFLVVLLIIAGFGWWIIAYLELSAAWGAIPVTASIGAAWAMLKDVFNVKLQPLSRYTPVTMIQAPSTTAEQYEALLLGQLNAFRGTKDGKHCERIVVFVDDLDRLSADEMVEGLDAIRIFMDIPPDAVPDCGIVFVVSCDEARVAESLSRRAKRGTNTNMPGTISDLGDARRFLDRIFQFRLEIPPFPRRDMRTYAIQKLEKFPDIVSSLSKLGVTSNQLAGRLMHVGVESPRNALQIINTFLQAWWVATKREAAGKLATKAGALRHGAVTHNPISLAALCVLKVDFPDFYKRLQLVPDLLQAYERLVLDGGKLHNEPIAIQEVIAEFVQVEKDEKVAAKDRDLRRFIASTRDVKKPRSLRPLLLLTEDDLSLQLGDRADDVRDAMVSGDTTGVLEALGRVEDDKELRTDDVELLKDILDHLTTESDDRRDKASVVIADLLGSDRLPVAESMALVTRLARRLSESLRLRCRLGVVRIQDVAQRALDDDRRGLVSRLCHDILRAPESEWVFTTPGGEQPRLDLAVPMVESVCQLALETWKDVGLLPEAEQIVVSWVKTRRVSVSGETTDLSFEKFDRWVADFEDILLGESGEEYVEQLLKQLEAGSPPDIDLPAAISRVESVFAQLKVGGTETASRMWKMVGRCATVQAAEGPEFAANFLKTHAAEAQAAELSTCVKTLAGRLGKEMKDEKEWPLDWKECGQSLLAVCESRPTDLHADSFTALATLTESWGDVGDTVPFAVRGADLLSTHAPDSIAAVIDDWITRFRSETELDLVKWFAERFASKLTASQQVAVVAQINHYVGGDPIAEDEGSRFQVFVSNLSDDGCKHEQIQGFISRLFPKVAERFNNVAYLEAVFPTVPRLVKFAPAAQSGSMLNGLFNRAKDVPAIYGRLHSWMVGHWPIPHESSYNPNAIFAAAASFAESQPHQAMAVGVVHSMADMLKRKLVDGQEEIKLASAACALWPHAAVDVMPTMLNLSVTPTAKEIATLVQDIDTEQEEHVDRLEQVWKYFATQMESDRITEVAQELLGFDQIEFPIGKKDGALQLWCEVAERNRDAILASLANSEELVDSQRHRIWIEIESRESELAPSLFKNIVPSILIRNDSPDTVAAILRWADDSQGVIEGQSDQAAFCKALAPAYFDTPSADTRDSIAKWIDRFNGTSAIEGEMNNRELSDDDRDAIRTHFPSLRV